MFSENLEMLLQESNNVVLEVKEETNLVPILNQVNSIVLNKIQFQTFLRILNIMKDLCNDVDIRQGIIRQRSASKDCAFDINLSELFTFDIPIINLKEKLELFSLFTNSEEITIQLEDNNSGKSFSISDDTSKLNFKSIISEYLEHPFIGDEELESIFTFNNDEIVLDVNISSKISSRIKTICKVFNLRSIQVDFNGEFSRFYAQSINTEKEAEFLKDISTNENINCSTSLLNIPFIIDHDDDINLKMFNRGVRNICFNKFTTKISDIEVKIYTASTLKFEESEEE